MQNVKNTCHDSMRNVSEQGGQELAWSPRAFLPANYLHDVATLFFVTASKGAGRSGPRLATKRENVLGRNMKT